MQIAQKAVISHRQTTNKATPNLHRLAKSVRYVCTQTNLISVMEYRIHTHTNNKHLISVMEY